MDINARRAAEGGYALEPLYPLCKCLVLEVLTCTSSFHDVDGGLEMNVLIDAG
jgi:hypothetical protein